MARKKKDQFLPAKTVAPNGLTVISKENHSTPIISVTVYILGGSRMEEGRNNGITNLTQRLLLKGTKKRSAEEIARQIESIGCIISPFTGKDTLGISMKLLPRHFDRGLDILADCMINPAFAENRIEREKKNVQIEIRKRRDEVLSHCLELCDEVLFNCHPYRRPIQGTGESVGRIAREEIVNWHRYMYNPSRMVVGVVGDIRGAEVERKIIEKLSGLQPNDSPLKKLMPEEPIEAPRTLIELSRKRQVGISIGFFAPNILSKDALPFEVMEHILSGMGSRLFIELRDRQGLAYSVSCTYGPRIDNGVFKTYILTSQEQKKRAFDAILEELEKLTKERVEKEELDRAKNYMLGLYEISHQRNSSQATDYAYYELVGLGYEFVDNYPARIRRVSADSIKTVAEKYLGGKRYGAAILAESW